MKKESYIPFTELAQLQKERPGIFPVFKKIHRVDGQMIGEVEGYSDSFGNRYDLPEEETFLN